MVLSPTNLLFLRSAAQRTSAWPFLSERQHPSFWLNEPRQGLREGVDLVVMAAVRECHDLRAKLFQPRS